MVAPKELRGMFRTERRQTIVNTLIHYKSPLLVFGLGWEVAGVGLRNFCGRFQHTLVCFRSCCPRFVRAMRCINFGNSKTQYSYVQASLHESEAAFLGERTESILLHATPHDDKRTGHDKRKPPETKNVGTAESGSSCNERCFTNMETDFFSLLFWLRVKYTCHTSYELGGRFGCTK
jgi:hypothetical protein